jgi:hypothetical protein
MTVEKWFDVQDGNMKYSVNYMWDANSDSEMWTIYHDGVEIDGDKKTKLIKVVRKEMESAA